MKRYIEYTDLDAKDFVLSTTRYANSQVVYYGDSKILTFETYKPEKIFESSSDSIAIISPGVAYRPDLVSYQSYGTSEFWWKIMEANNMKDILEFKAGTTIRIPSQFF